MKFKKSYVEKLSRCFKSSDVSYIIYIGYKLEMVKFYSSFFEVDKLQKFNKTSGLICTKPKKMSKSIKFYKFHEHFYHKIEQTNIINIF